jgi:hypothetical protein
MIVDTVTTWKEGLLIMTGARDGPASSNVGADQDGLFA